MTVWLVALCLMLVLAGVLTWRWPGRGALASLAGLWLFYQVSSLLFLNPFYKDGGNGTLADWWIWLVQAGLIVAGLSLVMRAMKLVMQRRATRGPRNDLL